LGFQIISPTLPGMKVIITGTTGMVGEGVLHVCLHHGGIGLAMINATVNGTSKKIIEGKDIIQLAKTKP